MRIVTIGGGTGQGQLLRGLARRGVKVTGIVGVTDNGGHSGALRRAYGIPAVGDLRNCLRALADDSPLARVLDFRFASAELEGASAGNLLLAGMTLSEGSLAKAAAALSKPLGLRGTVLPVSDGDAQIAAELEDGRTIVGEWNLIRRKPRTAIARLFHDRPLIARADVLAAVRRTDLVVLAPGSLRTGIVSVLLAVGLKEALARARVLQVLNLLTQPGQTDGFSARDHVAEVARYLGREPDVVLSNSKRPPAWALDGAEVVAPIGVKADLLERISPADRALRARPSKFVSGPHLVRHDPERLAAAILNIARRSRR